MHHLLLPNDAIPFVVAIGMTLTFYYTTKAD